MSLTQITHRAKDLHGDKRALVYADRVTSFREFHQQVALCASTFVGLAPGGDVRVGILSLNSDRAIVSFHAAIWAGMVPNYLNIRWAAFELGQSIDDFTPSILVVDDTFLELGRAR